MKHKCDNCGKKWDIKDLLWIHATDLHQRVDPGGVVPSGECPACEALCYPEKAEEKQLAQLANEAAEGLKSILAGVGIEYPQRQRVRCTNKKCVHYELGDCNESNVVLSRASADHDHLSQYMLECISFEERDEPETEDEKVLCAIKRITLD